MVEVVVVVDGEWDGVFGGCGYGVCDAVFVQGCAALMPLNMGMGSTDQGPEGQGSGPRRDRATVRNGWWSSRRANPAFESELREGVCVGGNFSGLVSGLVNVGDGKEKGGGGRSGVGWMDRSGRSGRGDGRMIGWMNGIGRGGRGVGMLNGRGRSGRGGGWMIRSERGGRGVGMLNVRGRRRSGVLRRNSYLPTYRRQRRRQDLLLMTPTLTRWGRNVVKEW